MVDHTVRVRAAHGPADPERDLTPERLRGRLAEGVTALVAEETDTGAAWRALRRAVTEAGIDCPRDASPALLGSPPADLADGPEPTGFDIPPSSPRARRKHVARRPAACDAPPHA